MRHRSLFTVAALVLPSLAGMVLAAPAGVSAAQAAKVAPSSAAAAVEVSQAFLDAIVSQDVVSACGLLAPSALAEFEARSTTCQTQMGFFAGDEQVRVSFGRYATSLSKETVVVAGSRATVPLDVQTTLTLTLTGDGWRVSVVG
jgi:hypothetical protein